MNPNAIAKMIDHSILHPTWTDDDLKRECAVAMNYDVATVCVKPYHVHMAAELVRSSSVGVCAVIGFPHGNSTVEIKAAEATFVTRDGATEVDMVVNIGKVLQGDWKYVDHEIRVINETCLKNNAILKVIFENDFLQNDAEKIKLCELCGRNNVAFVKTSTGYGFVKGADGTYSYTGATEHDIKLMRHHCPPEVQIKAAGGIRTLDQLLVFRELGVTRVGATATATIVDEARKRFGTNEAP